MSASDASRCVLVPFERYGHTKNALKKVLPTFFPCMFYVKTK